MNRHRALLVCSLTALIATPLLAAPLLADWDDGVAAFHAGRYQDAAAVFQSYVSSRPQAPEGHYMLGLSLLRQKRVTDALGPLSEALARRRDDLRYRMTLAQALLKADKPGDAFDTLDAQDPAAVADSSRTSFNQLLAKAASSSGRDGRAFASLERALATDGGSRVLWLALANVAGRLDRPEDVFSTLAVAFEIDPSDPEPGRGAVHAALEIAREQPDVDRKLEWYRKGAGISDRMARAFSTPEHQRLAGSANMGARNYESAVSYFEQALAADDQDPLLHFDLGRCRQALGQSSEALAHLSAALERSPDAQLTRDIHRVRARALRVLEDFAGAAAAFLLAGDAGAAAEMDDYAQNRREWAKEKADCIEKRTGLKDLLADSKGLEHTREYQEVQQDLSTILRDCEPYFNEQG